MARSHLLRACAFLAAFTFNLFDSRFIVVNSILVLKKLSSGCLPDKVIGKS
jgi:hypothetical protein